MARILFLHLLTTPLGVCAAARGLERKNSTACTIYTVWIFINFLLRPRQLTRLRCVSCTSTNCVAMFCYVRVACTSATGKHGLTFRWCSVTFWHQSTIHGRQFASGYEHTRHNDFIVWELHSLASSTFRLDHYCRREEHSMPIPQIRWQTMTLEHRTVTQSPKFQSVFVSFDVCLALVNCGEIDVFNCLFAFCLRNRYVTHCFDAQNVRGER